MRKRTLLVTSSLIVLASTAVLAQQEGIQAVVGNVFLQNTTPGTVQPGHASIGGTFRAGQVNVSQATGTTIPVIGNNSATGAGASVGGSFSAAQQSSIALRGKATSTTGANIGVYGETRSASGTGVLGLARSSLAFGVHAKNTNLSGAALVAENAPTGLAARFVGLAEFLDGVSLNGDRQFSSIVVKRGGLDRFKVSQAGVGKLALRLNTTGGSPFGSVLMQPAILNGNGAQIIVYGTQPNIGAISTLADGRVSISAQIKNFVEVDPRDPTRDIVYTCIEGPEAAMYTRGTSRLTNGRAYVTIPGHFSALASAVGVTVTLTPGSGSSKGLAWQNKSNTGFEVVELSGGKGNYEFDWEVKAVRKAYEDYEASRPWASELVPASEHAKVLEARRRVAAQAQSLGG